jgi:hypothetical protein
MQSQLFFEKSFEHSDICDTTEQATIYFCLSLFFDDDKKKKHKSTD